jgi:hypothetical protein
MVEFPPLVIAGFVLCGIVVGLVVGYYVMKPHRRLRSPQGRQTAIFLESLRTTARVERGEDVEADAGVGGHRLPAAPPPAYSPSPPPAYFQ